MVDVIIPVKINNSPYNVKWNDNDRDGKVDEGEATVTNGSGSSVTALADIASAATEADKIIEARRDALSKFFINFQTAKNFNLADGLDNQELTALGITDEAARAAIKAYFAEDGKLTKEEALALGMSASLYRAILNHMDAGGKTTDGPISTDHFKQFLVTLRRYGEAYLGYIDDQGKRLEKAFLLYNSSVLVNRDIAADAASIRTQLSTALIVVDYIKITDAATFRTALNGKIAPEVIEAAVTYYTSKTPPDFTGLTAEKLTSLLLAISKAAEIDNATEQTRIFGFSVKHCNYGEDVFAYLTGKKTLEVEEDTLFSKEDPEALERESLKPDRLRDLLGEIQACATVDALDKLYTDKILPRGLSRHPEVLKELANAYIKYSNLGRALGATKRMPAGQNNGREVLLVKIAAEYLKSRDPSDRERAVKALQLIAESYAFADEDITRQLNAFQQLGIKISNGMTAGNLLAAVQKAIDVPAKAWWIEFDLVNSGEKGQITLKEGMDAQLDPAINRLRGMLNEPVGSTGKARAHIMVVLAKLLQIKAGSRSSSAKDKSDSYLEAQRYLRAAYETFSDTAEKAVALTLMVQIIADLSEDGSASKDKGKIKLVKNLKRYIPKAVVTIKVYNKQGIQITWDSQKNIKENLGGSKHKVGEKDEAIDWKLLLQVTSSAPAPTGGTTPGQPANPPAPTARPSTPPAPAAAAKPATTEDAAKNFTAAKTAIDAYNTEAAKKPADRNATKLQRLRAAANQAKAKVLGADHSRLPILTSPKI